MRILMTGASGCVGSALVRQLVGDGHEVICLSRQIPDNSNDIEHIALDLSCLLDRSLLPPSCDVVVHAAQSRQYREFPAGAENVFAINVAATAGLVNYAVDAGARQFLYYSTGSVYKPQATPISESGPTTNSNYYSSSKLAAEALLEPYANFLNIHAQRLFYVYGPGQQNMLMTGLQERVAKGEEITIQGTDGIRITPTFSGDVALVGARAIKENWSGIMNVASPEIVTLRSVVEVLAKKCGIDPKIVETQDTPPQTVLPDVTRLSGKMDLTTFRNLEAGIDLTF